MNLLLITFLTASPSLADRPADEQRGLCMSTEQPASERAVCKRISGELEDKLQELLHELTAPSENPAAPGANLQELRNTLNAYNAIVAMQSLPAHSEEAEKLVAVATACKVDALDMDAPNLDLRASVAAELCAYRHMSMANELTEDENKERVAGVITRLGEAADALYERNEWLRNQLNMNSYLELVDRASIDEYVDELQANRLLLEAIRRETGYNVNSGDLYVPFSALDPFHVDYTVGVNFLTVNDAFEEGYPVAGITIYRRFVSTERLADTGNNGVWLNEVHFAASLRMNGIGEQAVAISDEGDGGGGGLAGLEEYPDRAFDLDLSIFLPILESNFNKGHSYGGLILNGGGRMIDDDSHFRGRQYIGWRATYNPHFYVDLMYGKSDGLESNRWELRGQMPIYRGGKNNFIYAGITMNVGVGKKADNEPDSINFFLLYQSDVKSLFNLE